MLLSCPEIPWSHNTPLRIHVERSERIILKKTRIFLSIFQISFLVYECFFFLYLGLQQVEAECKKLEIQFHLLEGEPTVCVPQMVQKLNLDGVVTDFSPLRLPVSWVENVKKNLPENVPFCQVSPLFGFLIVDD